MEPEVPNEDIPNDFYCFRTGKPFDKCSDCERNLLEPGVMYVIEKAIRQYEGFTAKDVIFECAICLSCAEKVKEELSKESLKAMMEFYEEEMMPGAMANENEPLTTCAVTGKPREELTNYQINALCEGNSISHFQAPYLVSGGVLDELNELLSNSTRDFLDGYQRKINGPVPEWFKDDVPTGGRLVLI